MAFWEDSLRYLYLPRLKTRDVLWQAIRSGASSGQQGTTFEGFKFGDADIQFDDTLLLIEPEVARAYAAALDKPTVVNPPEAIAGEDQEPVPVDGGQRPLIPGKTTGDGKGTKEASRAKTFIGTAEINPAMAKMRLAELADEIISVLCSDPNASVRVTVEISAEFQNGASEQIRRAVSENANSLGLKTKSWE